MPFTTSPPTKGACAIIKATTIFLTNGIFFNIGVYRYVNIIVFDIIFLTILLLTSYVK